MHIEVSIDQQIFDNMVRLFSYFHSKTLNHNTWNQQRKHGLHILACIKFVFSCVIAVI